MPITSVDVPKFTSNQVDLVYLEGFWPYMTIWMFNTVDEQTLVPVEIANNVYQLVWAINIISSKFERNSLSSQEFPPSSSGFKGDPKKRWVLLPSTKYKWLFSKGSYRTNMKSIEYSEGASMFYNFESGIP